LKRLQINQDLAELQEQAAKNNGLALQANSKDKEKVIQSTMRTLVMVMVMMNLIMSKWLSLSRIIEES
jgi:hypothetical protein